MPPNKYHCTYDDCVAREAEDIAVKAGWTRLVDLGGELLGRCPLHAEPDSIDGLPELFDSLKFMAQEIGIPIVTESKFDQKTEEFLDMARKASKHLEDAPSMLAWSDDED
jgi:hypothetical protein